MFEDNDIRTELEDYHIRKDAQKGSVDDDRECVIRSSIEEMENLARSGSGNELMNNRLTDYEVGKTFCNGSSTPGPDDVASRLIDEADRELMHECLKILWNKAWSDGHFISEWKRENRVIIPKLGKEDYSECSAYRTISLTSCLGKRFEYISTHRLTVVLNSVNFDQHQFAYLKNRSSTQALLVLTEKIKQGLIKGETAGVVFFD